MNNNLDRDWVINLSKNENYYAGNNSITIDSWWNTYFIWYFYSGITIWDTTIVGNWLSDWFIGKVDINGNLAWLRGFGWTGYDRVYEIHVDWSWNIYIVGDFEGSAMFWSINMINNWDQSLFVAKLDNNGNWVRVKQWWWTTNYCYKIEMNNSWNIVILGSFQWTWTFWETELVSSWSNDPWDSYSEIINFLVELDQTGNWINAELFEWMQIDFVNMDVFDNIYLFWMFPVSLSWWAEIYPAWWSFYNISTRDSRYPITYTTTPPQSFH